MSKASRLYVSQIRSDSANATKARVLRAAQLLFARRGIDRVTIGEIAQKAKVSVSTVFTLYKSKAGILRALMKSALFGQRFQAAIARLEGETDPVALIALTANIARAIYEGESSELGLIRGVSAFSSDLRKLEQEFEDLRFQMQRERVVLLFARSKQRKGLTLDEARRIMWMYTSRDVYRLLVHEGGWTPYRYQKWLSITLLHALVDPRHGRPNAIARQRNGSRRLNHRASYRDRPARGRRSSTFLPNARPNS
jgi:AcrR family transcriptional regulator